MFWFYSDHTEGNCLNWFKVLPRAMTSNKKSFVRHPFQNAQPYYNVHYRERP